MTFFERFKIKGLTQHFFLYLWKETCLNLLHKDAHCVRGHTGDWCHVRWRIRGNWIEKEQMLTLDALKRIAFLSTHKQTDSSHIFLFECGSLLVRRFKRSSSGSKDFLEFILFHMHVHNMIISNICFNTGHKHICKYWLPAIAAILMPVITIGWPFFISLLWSTHKYPPTCRNHFRLLGLNWLMQWICSYLFEMKCHLSIYGQSLQLLCFCFSLYLWLKACSCYYYTTTWDEEEIRNSEFQRLDL